MIPQEILQKVRRIEIRTKSIVDAVLSGQYHSAFKGRGIEFSEVRSYMEGDDIRTIDWNVTARTGEPHVKRFIEERELTIMLMVDASASGEFGSQGRFKGEIAVELCSVIAFSAIKNNDRVGLIIFTDTVEVYIPPRKGKNHVLRVIRELLFFKPRNRGTDIGTAVGFLNRVQRKKAVVFCISDFFDSAFHAPLRVTARRHDCIAVTMRDPRESHIPAVGLLELRDPETGRTIVVDTSDPRVRRHLNETSVQRAGELRSFFRATGIDEIKIGTGDDYIESLLRFFAAREKAMA